MEPLTVSVQPPLTDVVPELTVSTTGTSGVAVGVTVGVRQAQVGVSVTTGVLTCVSTAVLAGVFTGETVAVFTGVFTGVSVAVFTAVRVELGVAVSVLVLLLVTLKLGLMVGVWVAVLPVGTGLKVIVSEGVAVLVGVWLPVTVRGRAAAGVLDTVAVNDGVLERVRLGVKWAWPWARP